MPGWFRHNSRSAHFTDSVRNFSGIPKQVLTYAALSCVEFEFVCSMHDCLAQSRWTARSRSLILVTSIHLLIQAELGLYLEYPLHVCCQFIKLGVIYSFPKRIGTPARLQVRILLNISGTCWLLNGYEVRKNGS